MEWSLTRPSLAPHIHHGSDTIPRLHYVERLVDFRECLSVCDEFVYLELPAEVIADQVR